MVQLELKLFFADVEDLAISEEEEGWIGNSCTENFEKTIMNGISKSEKTLN